jgi:hypothetical protein
MIRPRVIGVAGRARVGKDTAARMLHGLGVGDFVYAFADPLRAMLRAGLGIDMSLPYWQEHKEKGLPEFGGASPRRIMQTLGTEWGRELIHGDIWLTLAFKRLMEGGGRGMIVSDCRFENETAWIRRVGGLVVHIERAAAEAVRPHSSEAGVAVGAGDWVVANNGTLRELERELARRFEVDHV